MKVYNYLAERAERLQSQLKYATNDLEYALEEVERLKKVQKELMEELSEFDEFFDKREAVEDAIGRGNSGILVESLTEDVRQPGTESGMSL